MLRAFVLFALFLAVSTFPADQSSGNGMEGSGGEHNERVKKDTLMISQRAILISGPEEEMFHSESSGSESSGSDEETVRGKRNVSDEGSGIDEKTNSTSGVDGKTNDTCTAFAECYEDDNCGSGKCTGFALKTCNCNACNQFFLCKVDNDCGGLRGACTNGLCDCYQAFTKHNYTDVFDAWTRLCNTKSCSKKTEGDDCFGLPCNKGFCTC